MGQLHPALVGLHPKALLGPELDLSLQPQPSLGTPGPVRIPVTQRRRRGPLSCAVLAGLAAGGRTAEALLMDAELGADLTASPAAPRAPPMWFAERGQEPRELPVAGTERLGSSPKAEAHQPVIGEDAALRLMTSEGTGPGWP